MSIPKCINYLFLNLLEQRFNVFARRKVNYVCENRQHELI